MEELPEVMKICYQALNNTINEIGYKLFMNHGSCVTSHLRKTVSVISLSLALPTPALSRALNSKTWSHRLWTCVRLS